MHNGDGRTLPSYIYPIKYFYEPLLPYDSLLDNTILLVSTSSILIDFSNVWNLYLYYVYTLFIQFYTM